MYIDALRWIRTVIIFDISFLFAYTCDRVYFTELGIGTHPDPEAAYDKIPRKVDARVSDSAQLRIVQL